MHLGDDHLASCASRSRAGTPLRTLGDRLAGQASRSRAGESRPDRSFRRDLGAVHLGDHLVSQASRSRAGESRPDRSFRRDRVALLCGLNRDPPAATAGHQQQPDEQEREARQR